jgi:hypothetical protein
MHSFDDLPRATRRLLVAKLNLEIVSAHCANILDLAKKRNQSVRDVWRDICRNAGVIHCLMPPQLIESQYAANASVWYGMEVEATASHRSVEQVHPVRALTRVSEQSRTTGQDMPAAATAAPARSASPARARPSRNGLATLAAGLGITFVAGIALYMMAAPSGPATTARPSETIRRIDQAKSDERGRPDPVEVPPPQGTVKRMDAISKSFSKK